MGEQLTFPSAPVDADTAATLQLVDGDHLHAADRARVDTAIRTIAAADGGVVDPGQVRRLLTNEHGLTVYPRVLSARYFALRKAGLIERAGWTTNDDQHGRNAGRPARLYRWTGGAL